MTTRYPIEALLLDERAALFRGDAGQVGEVLGPDTVDAIVCDPPAGISFMGKEWDGDKGGRDHWVAWLRDELGPAIAALKPGGHVLAWAIPRTSHWTAAALEDAGLEIRDVVTHLFGTGFPKSMDVGKQIDAYDAAQERRRRSLVFTAWMRSTGLTVGEVDAWTSSRMGSHYFTDKEQPHVATEDMFAVIRRELGIRGIEVPAEIERLVHDRTVESENTKARAVVGHETMVDTSVHCAGFAGARYNSEPLTRREVAITVAHSPEAVEWEGWGTALKPAAEHWILARKPPKGTIASNVLRYRTGALNIAACSVAERWPAHLTLSHSPECVEVGELHACVPGCAVRLLDDTGPKSKPKKARKGTHAPSESIGTFVTKERTTSEPADRGGGVSRFYYCAKAHRSEKDAGCEHLPLRSGGDATDREEGSAGLNSPRAGAGRGGGVRNHHPTAKSIALMRWFIRLITPPGGLVLDCFAGSATTGIAALAEGCEFVGFERDRDENGELLGYGEVGRARLSWALREYPAQVARTAIEQPQET